MANLPAIPLSQVKDRDLFAALIFSGIVSRNINLSGDGFAEARCAVNYADALVRALNGRAK